MNQTPRKPKTSLKDNPFLGLWILLLVSLGVVTAYSFVDDPFVIELKKSDAADYLRRDTLSSDSTALAALEKKAPVVDSSKQSILLIGDSMLEGLSPRLFEYAIHNGHNYNAVVWYSSTTKYFGQSDTLSHFIRKFKPTYILVSLGANELFVKNIKKERLNFMRKILKDIDTIPYLWIGPPNWKDDTGINELIVENTGKGRYYPSKRLKYDRAKDGAHPTHKSAALWADSISRWIADSSAYRIVLEKPDAQVKSKGNGIRNVLQPLK